MLCNRACGLAVLFPLLASHPESPHAFIFFAYGASRDWGLGGGGVAAHKLITLHRPVMGPPITVEQRQEPSNPIL